MPPKRTPFVPPPRRWLLVSLVLLAALPALADPPPATEATAPPAPAEVAEVPVADVIGYSYLAGVGAAAVTVPAMLYAGEAIGARSNNLVAAALPGLLLFAVVPPLATTAAEWLVARKLSPGTMRFHPAVWGAVVLNLVGLVAAAAGGVWTGDATSTGLFTVAEALVVPAGSALIMYLTRRRPPKPAPRAALPASPAALPRTPTLHLDGERRSVGLAPAGLVVPVLALSF